MWCLDLAYLLDKSKFVRHKAKIGPITKTCLLSTDEGRRKPADDLVLHSLHSHACGHAIRPIATSHGLFGLALVWLLDDDGLCGEQDACNAASVLQAMARDLGRVQDACLQKILNPVLHLHSVNVSPLQYVCTDSLSEQV